MRRDRSFQLLLACAILAIPHVASAQRFIREQRQSRAWLVLSDGIGVNGDGVSGSTGLSQLFRASGTVVVTRTIGVELSALRIQEVYPANKLFNDPAVNNPKGDGLMIAFASLNRDGPRGRFPALFSIGGGVMRRPTNDPAKDRVTGGFQVGLESSLWKSPVEWMDATAGGRVILMPAGNHHQLYMLALTVGLRIG